MCCERYKCGSCGAVFDDPYIYEIDEDMNGEGAWYTWTIFKCPYCYSDAVWEYEEEDEDDALSEDV